MRAPGSIVSTNTSGIPLAAISEGFTQEFRQHFLGTHFFNPPRYLHLVEIIRGADTAPARCWISSRDFCDRRLGKGVVPCKDTPNFIANRIGVFFGATIHKITVEDDYSIEEVDALTGPLIGLPKSASYRLLDIIGLDIWALVTRNLYELAPHDPWRERFVLPALSGGDDSARLAGREKRARAASSASAKAPISRFTRSIARRWSIIPRRSRDLRRSKRRRTWRTSASVCACWWQLKIAQAYFSGSC